MAGYPFRRCTRHGCCQSCYASLIAPSIRCTWELWIASVLVWKRCVMKNIYIDGCRESPTIFPAQNAETTCAKSTHRSKHGSTYLSWNKSLGLGCHRSPSPWVGPRSPRGKVLSGPYTSINAQTRCLTPLIRPDTPQRRGRGWIWGGRTVLDGTHQSKHRPVNSPEIRHNRSKPVVLNRNVGDMNDSWSIQNEIPTSSKKPKKTKIRSRSIRPSFGIRLTLCPRHQIFSEIESWQLQKRKSIEITCQTQQRLRRNWKKCEACLLNLKNTHCETWWKQTNRTSKQNNKIHHNFC